MNNHNEEFRVRQPDNDGWRTPVIEDDDHPLNLWRTQHTNGTALESSFPSQDGMSTENFNRFQQTEPPPPPIEKAHAKPGDRYVNEEHLPWRERVKHTSWAWFTMTMATGGLANVLHAGKHYSQLHFEPGACSAAL